MVVVVVIVMVKVVVMVMVVMMAVVVFGQRQLSELHYLPYSLNSLDDNSVDLANSKQEIKARWGF